MALDVYFKSDILNILRSVGVTNDGLSSIIYALIDQQGDQGANMALVKLVLDVYLAGVSRTLNATATAFDLGNIQGQKPPLQELVIQILGARSPSAFLADYQNS